MKHFVALLVQVELLNGETCLALNLFLAKHNFVPEELVAWLLQGNIESVGADKLKLLITLLPSEDEVRITA